LFLLATAVGVGYGVMQFIDKRAKAASGEAPADEEKEDLLGHNSGSIVASAKDPEGEDAI
jgi:hypothetical protein